MKRVLKAAFCAASVMLLASCENTTEPIGSSLIQGESEVVIHGEFSLEGHTTENQRIESRTIVQLLGDIDAEGYGKFSSDFVCQFMPASKLNTDGVTAADIDSMKLVLTYLNGGYVGDSIAPMGLEVYLLNKQLPQPIFSSLDPTDYCDLAAGPLASTIYVGNAQGQNDSIQALKYREIQVSLPLSLARNLFNLYVSNPGAYSFPSEFARHFPGIYVRNSYGAGRVTQIQQTAMVMYYHTASAPTKAVTGNYFAVTPEVVSNNNISFTIDPALQARIDAGESILVAPVGRDVEITFPIRDVIEYYVANKGALSVVNALTMKIPVETIANDYGIAPPENLLMVLSDKKESFFLNNSLPDDETSFLATYSAGDKAYYFSALRAYFMKMYEKYTSTGVVPQGDITFTLTPVMLTTETQGTNTYYSTATTYVSAVTPYIGRPAMGRLAIDKADIVFQFSKQSYNE